MSNLMGKLINNSAIRKVKENLPLRLQRIVSESVILLSFLIFKLRLKGTSSKNVPNPATIYWISPDRIIYHTNYKKVECSDTTMVNDRALPVKMFGKIVGGNWDITDCKFTDLDVFKAFQKRIKEGAEWKDTKFYSRVLNQVESGRFVWNIKNKSDLDKRCRYLDALYESIKNEGYQLSRDKCTKAINFDEIWVNIGRNGEYLFQNGVHRLSIAKILGIKRVPVIVFVRHKKWVKFRESLLGYAREGYGGRLYQPLIHPDLADIPYNNQNHNWLRLMEAIKKNLSKKNGLMLDIGANLGFFCHKFEDIGYRCYAVENDIIFSQIAEKIRNAENKKFKIINKSIFQVKSINDMKFDVVLALNIFHHFLKTKRLFSKFQDLLKNLQTTELFFEPHLYGEIQMKNAYINFNETEFVDFILHHSSLNKARLIYRDQSGRPVYKLSK